MPVYDNTLGAVFVGGWVAAIFYGITCVQAYIFLRYRHSGEKPRLKYAVLALWLADTLHSIFVAKTLYWYLVNRFGQADAVGGMPWSMMASVCMDNISDSIVRIFFAYRVWILSGKNRWVTGMVIALIIVTPVTGFVGAGFGFTYSTFEQFAKIGWLMLLHFSLAVAADVYIAAALVSYLLRSRPKLSGTGFQSDAFKRTDDIVNGLVAYFINTGVLTCLASTFCLAFYIAYPHNFIFLAFHFPISPIYVNALLGSLNARSSLRAYCVCTSGSSVPTNLTFLRSSMGGATSQQAFSKHQLAVPNQSVTVRSDTLHDSDPWHDRIPKCEAMSLEDTELGPRGYGV